MAYQNSKDYFHSAADQTPLFWQKWIPDGAVNCVLVFQHGLGEHCGRYQNLLEAMEGTGTACYAMDARGHGMSDGKKGHVQPFYLFADDLHQFVEMVKEEQKIDKVFLLGHSLGGVIAIDFALQHQSSLKGLILSAPGIQAYMNSYLKAARLMAKLLTTIAPALTLGANLKLDYLSHDTQVIADYKADPLVHGRASPALGYAMFNIHKKIYAQAADLTIPLLIIHGTGDKITNPKGSERFYQLAGSVDKTLKLYNGLYHEMINEIPIAKAEVLRDISAWIEQRIE